MVKRRAKRSVRTRCLTSNTSEALLFETVSSMRRCALFVFLLLHEVCTAFEAPTLDEVAQGDTFKARIRTQLCTLMRGKSSEVEFSVFTSDANLPIETTQLTAQKRQYRASVWQDFTQQLTAEQCSAAATEGRMNTHRMPFSFCHSSQNMLSSSTTPCPYGVYTGLALGKKLRSFVIANVAKGAAKAFKVMGLRQVRCKSCLPEVSPQLQAVAWRRTWRAPKWSGMNLSI
eukprot:2997190-Amphidinium_carterae.1